MRLKAACCHPLVIAAASACHAYVCARWIRDLAHGVVASSRTATCGFPMLRAMNSGVPAGHFILQGLKGMNEVRFLGRGQPLRCVGKIALGHFLHGELRSVVGLSMAVDL